MIAQVVKVRSFQDLMPRKSGIGTNENVVLLGQGLAHVSGGHDNPDGVFGGQDWDAPGDGKLGAEL